MHVTAIDFCQRSLILDYTDVEKAPPTSVFTSHEGCTLGCLRKKRKSIDGTFLFLDILDIQAIDRSQR